MENTSTQEKTLVVFDSDCGFCQASVDWFATRAEAAGVPVELIAYQDGTAQTRYPQVDWSHAETGMQVMLATGEVRKDIRAVAACLALVPGWKWFGALLDFILLRPFTQLGYRLVAGNRGKISGWLGLEQCRVRYRAK